MRRNTDWLSLGGIIHPSESGLSVFSMQGNKLITRNYFVNVTDTLWLTASVCGVAQGLCWTILAYTTFRCVCSATHCNMPLFDWTEVRAVMYGIVSLFTSNGNHNNEVSIAPPFRS